MGARAAPDGVTVVGGPAGVAALSALVSSGTDVVVVLPPGAALPARPDGPGRLAVLVGDWHDPDVRTAANEMAAELFGA